MGDTAFEQITDEILKIKQRMEELHAENEEMRQQLKDLREGRGIFVDILGQRFPLNGDSIVAQPPSTSEIESSTPEEQDIDEMPTLAISEVSLPASNGNEQPSEEEQEEAEPAEVSTFLEEALVDEFAEAATNSSPIWEDPDTQKRPSVKDIDEEQKAALRKALVGSFLLE